jgi:hypothetical protein
MRSPKSTIVIARRVAEGSNPAPRLPGEAVPVTTVIASVSEAIQCRTSPTRPSLGWIASPPRGLAMTMPRMPHSLTRTLAQPHRQFPLKTIPHCSLLLAPCSFIYWLASPGRLETACRRWRHPPPPPQLNSLIKEYTVFRTKQAFLHVLAGFLSDFKFVS